MCCSVSVEIQPLCQLVWQKLDRASLPPNPVTWVKFSTLTLQHMIDSYNPEKLAGQKNLILSTVKITTCYDSYHLQYFMILVHNIR